MKQIFLVEDDRRKKPHRPECSFGQCGFYLSIP